MEGATTPDPDDSLEAIRRMLERATSAKSLRHVAYEIGISPTGLHSFLSGATNPHPSTRRKLATWCRMQADREQRPTSKRTWIRQEGPAALAELVGLVPAPARESAARQIRTVMARSYRAAGVPVPAWLDNGLGN